MHVFQRENVSLLSLSPLSVTSYVVVFFFRQSNSWYRLDCKGNEHPKFPQADQGPFALTLQDIRARFTDFRLYSPFGASPCIPVPEVVASFCLSGSTRLYRKVMVPVMMPLHPLLVCRLAQGSCMFESVFCESASPRMR